MRGLRYISGVTSLKLDAEKCTGCRVCLSVCPHAVFAETDDRRVRVADLDACMECGACAMNCAFGAISLKPGVGCAEAIINGWLHHTEPSCGDGAGGCCGSSTGSSPSTLQPTTGGCGSDSAAPS